MVPKYTVKTASIAVSVLGAVVGAFFGFHSANLIWNFGGSPGGVSPLTSSASAIGATTGFLSCYLVSFLFLESMKHRNWVMGFLFGSLFGGLAGAASGGTWIAGYVILEAIFKGSQFDLGETVQGFLLIGGPVVLSGVAIGAFAGFIIYLGLSRVLLTKID